MSQKRSNSHLRAQRDGKKRDHYTCQICGSHNHTEGHHMLDYQYGGAANTGNIVTLCHNCHEKVHHGNLDVFNL